MAKYSVCAKAEGRKRARWCTRRATPSAAIATAKELVRERFRNVTISVDGSVLMRCTKRGCKRAKKRSTRR